MSEYKRELLYLLILLFNCTSTIQKHKICIYKQGNRAAIKIEPTITHVWWTNFMKLVLVLKALIAVNITEISVIKHKRMYVINMKF